MKNVNRIVTSPSTHTHTHNRTYLHGNITNVANRQGDGPIQNEKLSRNLYILRFFLFFLFSRFILALMHCHRFELESLGIGYSEDEKEQGNRIAGKRKKAIFFFSE